MLTKQSQQSIDKIEKTQSERIQKEREFKKAIISHREKSEPKLAIDTKSEDFKTLMGAVMKELKEKFKNGKIDLESVNNEKEVL